MTFSKKNDHFITTSPLSIKIIITFIFSIKNIKDFITIIFTYISNILIMKKGILFFVLCLFFGVGAKAADPSAANPQRNAINEVKATIPVEGVSIQKDGVDISLLKVLIGDGPVTLTAKVIPDNATNKDVEWSTDSPGSFSVDNNGVLTFHKRGSASVFVKTKDGEFKDTCYVRVMVLADGIGIIGEHPIHHELVKGAELQLSGIVTPPNALNREIEWYSEENKNIVSVDNTGKVKALIPGSSFVVAKTKDGTNLTDTCYIDVIDSVHVTKVELEKTSMDLNVGEDNTIIGIITPSNATIKKLKFVSSDNSVVEITSTPRDTICNIKAKKEGTAYITVTSLDAPTVSVVCNISVKPIPETIIKLNKDTVRLVVGGRDTVKVTITPSNATYQSYSKNPKIANISDNGIIEGLAEGKTSVIVRSTENTKIADTCIVEVSAKVIPVEIVKLNSDVLNLIEGDTVSLTATIYPANATNKKVTWHSLNMDTATVSSNGLVTAFKVGKTSIIVTSEDGSKRDTCDVNVMERVIFVDPVITTERNGDFALSLMVPDNETITGAFNIGFPTGVTLDIANTKLVNGFETSSLYITGGNNNTWKIEIKKKDLKNMLRTSTNKEVLRIAYRINESVVNGTYDINISNAEFTFSGGTKVKEEKMTVKLKVDIITSNDFIESNKAYVYIADNRLFISSEKAETIYVYTINGILVFAKEKAEGEAAFDLKIQESVIVKGSSGWTQKVAK